MNKPRLIDANELLKRMCNENCYHECRDNMDRCVWWHYINDSPTAYNVDAVVEQLEAEMNKALMKPEDDEYYTGEAEGFAKAIEIVRKGGAE